MWVKQINKFMHSVTTVVCLSRTLQYFQGECVLDETRTSVFLITFVRNISLQDKTISNNMTHGVDKITETLTNQGTEFVLATLKALQLATVNVLPFFLHSVVLASVH
jgi:hypothetical protein